MIRLPVLSNGRHPATARPMPQPDRAHEAPPPLMKSFHKAIHIGARRLYPPETHRGFHMAAKSARPLRIIINADDLGISSKVDDQIFDLIEKRRITSATMLASGPNIADAARRARGFGHASFGIHLNATEFPPLAPSPALAGLLTDEGLFSGTSLRRTRLSRATAGALYREWSAQIQRLIDHGIDVSHIDGHQHVHTVPGVFPIIKRLQRDFGLNRVRISRNLYEDGQTISAMTRLGKALWTTAVRHFPATRTTDGFTSFQTFRNLSADRYRNFQSIELSVHPGNTLFVEETAALYEPWEGELEGSVELINYRQL